MQEEERTMLLSIPLINPSLMENVGVTLTTSDISFLTSLGSIRKYPKDTVLLDQGSQIDKLMFLLSGSARYVATGVDGSKRTYVQISAGCFLGEEPFFHRKPIVFQLKLIEDSDVLFIDANRIRELLANERICLFIIHLLAFKARMFALQVEDSAFRTPLQIVCKVLYCLSDEAYSTTKIHFTHREIAELTGLHRVTVSSMLATLKKQGIIHTDTKGTIVKLNREQLATIACIGSEAQITERKN